MSDRYIIRTTGQTGPTGPADTTAQAQIAAHLADASDAHDASAISVADAGGFFTGTDVEAVIQEIPTRYVSAQDPFTLGTRPVYLDMYHRFFRGVGYTSGVGTAGTTVATQPSGGASSLVVADATGFVNGQIAVVARGTANQQVIKISSISTNTLTLLGRNRAQWAVGTAVDHVWQNDTHPLDSSGYSALAYWLANLTLDKVPPTGEILFASGTMASTYTDANSEANVPVGWETIGTSGVSCVQASYSAIANPNARRGYGGYVAGTSSGDGVRTLTSIPVQPGQVINVSAFLKSTGGTPTMTVVDKNSTSTVLATFTVGAATSYAEGETNNTGGNATLEFLVPAGVRDIEVRIQQSTASAMQCYFDDVRVMVVDDRLPNASSRYLIEDVSRPIVWLGDSWGVNLYAKLEQHLETRTGVGCTVVNAAVTGQKLDEMNARIATDVVPYRPRYCVVDFGMNDLSSSYSQATMETNIDTCIRTLRSYGIKPIFLGIAPMTSQWSTSNDRNDQMRDRVMTQVI